MEEQKKTSSATIILSIIITAIIFGGGTYLYTVNIKDKEIADLNTQITQLQSGIAVDTVATASSTSTDETADWKTYTNDEYGFSFKYPSDWVNDGSYNSENRTTRGDTSFFAIKFSDASPTDSIDKTPNKTKNVYISIDQKKDLSLPLATWLENKFSSPNTELGDYKVGNPITMGGINGFTSNIGCCGGYDTGYVIEKDGYVYTLGTNFDESNGQNSDQNNLLSQLASTFQFTK